MKLFFRILLSPIWIPLALVVSVVIYVVWAIAAFITWLVSRTTFRQSWQLIGEYLS